MFCDKWIGIVKSIGIEIKCVYLNYCDLVIFYKNINLSKVNLMLFVIRVYC